jgi:hypothetical protein
MSFSAQLRLSLSMVNTGTSFNFQSNPTAFSFTVNFANGNNGPTPGTITISTAGTVVSLSQLSSGYGGPILLLNMDPTNFVDWGLQDTETGQFYPIGRLYPLGPPAFYQISPLFATEVPGTAPSNDFALYMKANTANCLVSVQAFDP